MALPLTSQWTLLACAIMAHADGVMDGEECERLMGLVEDEADGEEYSEWLGLISDPKRLVMMMEGLETPPPETHREILEQAWTIAIVDGERVQAELDALQGIAARLGVESVQLEFWREAWTTAQREFAEGIASALAFVLGGDGPVFAADRKLCRDVVWQLPTTNDHREKLLAISAVPQPMDSVAVQLSSIGRRKRMWALRLIAPAALASADSDSATLRFVALAEASGIATAKAEAMITSAGSRD